MLGMQMGWERWVGEEESLRMEMDWWVEIGWGGDRFGEEDGLGGDGSGREMGLGREVDLWMEMGGNCASYYGGGGWHNSCATVILGGSSTKHYWGFVLTTSRLMIKPN